jgi:hypothetical protein
LKNYNRPDTVDFLLAGVRKSEISQSVFMTMVISMYETCIARGITEMETNRELETNTNVSNIWKKFKNVHSRRSRVFIKKF